VEENRTALTPIEENKTEPGNVESESGNDLYN